MSDHPNPWRSKESPDITVEVLESDEQRVTFRLLTNSAGRPVAGTIHRGFQYLDNYDGTSDAVPYEHAMDAPQFISTARFLEQYEVARSLRRDTVDPNFGSRVK